MPDSRCIVDLDGDLVTLSSLGQSIQVYAADFMDEVWEEIEKRNKSNPLPEYVDENGHIQPGTHGRGDEFTAILRENLARKGLTVRDRKAIAIWDALKAKSEEYQKSFRNGGNSVASMDSLLAPSLADVALSELQSQPVADSAPKNVSTPSTTTASNEKPANET